MVFWLVNVVSVVLLAKAEQSSITESSFKGRIVNTYETTAATIISVVWSVIWQGRQSLLTKSKRQ